MIKILIKKIMNYYIIKLVNFFLQALNHQAKAQIIISLYLNNKNWVTLYKEGCQGYYWYIVNSGIK